MIKDILGGILGIFLAILSFAAYLTFIGICIIAALFMGSCVLKSCGIL